jgi:hypothetical protein
LSGGVSRAEVLARLAMACDALSTTAPWTEPYGSVPQTTMGILAANKGDYVRSRRDSKNQIFVVDVIGTALRVGGAVDQRISEDQPP